MCYVSQWLCETVGVPVRPECMSAEWWSLYFAALPADVLLKVVGELDERCRDGQAGEIAALLKLKEPKAFLPRIVKKKYILSRSASWARATWTS